MNKWMRLFIAIGVITALTACSSSKKKTNVPAPLPAYQQSIQARQVWGTNIGKVAFPLVPKVVASNVYLATSDGNVVMLDASSGKIAWSGSAGGELTSGVGSDGRITAVVTRNNDLVALDSQGNVLWTQRVASQVLTPPVVSGNRVFVNATDRSIQAYDANNGTGLWRQQQNIMESLTLRQNGVLDTYGNTLIAGLSSSLYGINPDTGLPEWGFPIATPRGSNEIDRLADLVGGVARNGDVLCARSYQNAISCLKANSHVLWSRKSNSSTGLGIDDKNVYAVESDGQILALDQSNGNVVWANSDFKWRNLTAPLALGNRTLVLGDSEGNIHFLSRKDGSVIGRAFSNGSGIAVTPIAVGDVLLIVTNNGLVYGFRPEE